MSITSFDVNIMRTIFSFCTPETKAQFLLSSRIFHEMFCFQSLPPCAVDSELHSLHTFTYLRSLTVAGTCITDRKMSQFLSKLKNLDHLDISHTKFGRLTFEAIAYSCKQIQLLDCSNCSQATDNDFVLIAGACNQLRGLLAGNTKMAHKALCTLRGIVVLDARNCKDAEDQYLSRFVNQNRTTLKSVDFSYTHAGSEVVETLIKLKSAILHPPSPKPMEIDYPGMIFEMEMPSNEEMSTTLYQVEMRGCYLSDLEQERLLELYPQAELSSHSLYE